MSYGWQSCLSGRPQSQISSRPRIIQKEVLIIPQVISGRAEYVSFIAALSAAGLEVCRRI